MKKYDFKAIARNVSNAAKIRMKLGLFPLRVFLRGGKQYKYIKPIDLDPRHFYPVIILQPGKVGSRSVLLSLKMLYKRLKLKTPIYHAHHINNIDRAEKRLMLRKKPKKAPLKKLQEWKELRKKIDDDPQQKWNIISLVRDPLALRISTFFQVLDELVPDWKPNYEQGTLSMEKLQSTFLETMEFNGLDNWFDQEIKAVWNIDVYETPFPSDVGYQIYHAQNGTRLLLIRLENLNDVIEDAIREFLGFDSFTLITTNTAEQKDYHDLYLRFKKMPLPVEFVEKAYQSRFAKHFYSVDEIEQFRQKWPKPSSGV